PRLAGDRLPNLTEHAVNEEAAWIPLTIARWYGERDRPIETLAPTAVWYSSGVPPVPIRWVVIRDPLGKIRHPGAAVRRSGCQSTADHLVVHLALAPRGHLPRDASSSGRRDTAPVVASGHPAHDASPHGTLLGHYAAGA